MQSKGAYGQCYNLAMEEQPISNCNKRNPDGTFAVGNPGGPGRPQGSVSIVSKINAKRILTDD
jgi:hypothetical protein